MSFRFTNKKLRPLGVDAFSLRIFCSECFFYTAPSVPSVKDGIMLILFDHYVSFLVPIVLLAPKLG